MAGSIYDVDLDSFINDGDVLGQDGDAALTLKVVVVEDELAEILGLADEIGLIDHTVHERGLAMVDVGDDRYVSDILHNLFCTTKLTESCKITVFRAQYEFFVVFLCWTQDLKA